MYGFKVNYLKYIDFFSFLRISAIDMLIDRKTPVIIFLF